MQYRVIVKPTNKATSEINQALAQNNYADRKWVSDSIKGTQVFMAACADSRQKYMDVYYSLLSEKIASGEVSIEKAAEYMPAITFMAGLQNNELNGFLNEASVYIPMDHADMFGGSCGGRAAKQKLEKLLSKGETMPRPFDTGLKNIHTNTGENAILALGDKEGIALSYIHTNGQFNHYTTTNPSDERLDFLGSLLLDIEDFQKEFIRENVGNYNGHDGRGTDFTKVQNPDRIILNGTHIPWSLKLQPGSNLAGTGIHYEVKPYAKGFPSLQKMVEAYTNSDLAPSIATAFQYGVQSAHDTQIKGEEHGFSKMKEIVITHPYSAEDTPQLLLELVSGMIRQSDNLAELLRDLTQRDVKITAIPEKEGVFRDGLHKIIVD